MEVVDSWSTALRGCICAKTKKNVDQVYRVNNSLAFTAQRWTLQDHRPREEKGVCVGLDCCIRGLRPSQPSRGQEDHGDD